MKSGDIKDQKLHVYVRDIETVFYDGVASSVTSLNEIGTFDILPFHANFISMVRKYVNIHEESGNIRQVPLNKGVIRVMNNEVEVYISF